MIGLFFLYVSLSIVCARPAPIQLLHHGTPVSSAVFESLEELARIVDISYCVGSTGISKPFQCLGKCSEFEGFELITTWNTGPLLSDSCGYIALSHEPYEKRVLVAFRGTYSIANTVADLSTKHAEYTPYPADNSSDSLCTQAQMKSRLHTRSNEGPACQNCTMHSGFLKSWQNTRCTVIAAVEQALEAHPDYKLVLVGHSLGGSVAAIAALELQARGLHPYVTTFGEARVGNRNLNRYIDRQFNLESSSPDDAIYRRVTHVDDPVPLLPPQEWGYEMHAGEIYISKASLPPGRMDVHLCTGDADPSCIAGQDLTTEAFGEVEGETITRQWGVPSRYKLWQLFFAHRDYFWRLGLCIPGGDPWDWNRGKFVMSDEIYDNEL